MRTWGIFERRGKDEEDEEGRYKGRKGVGRRVLGAGGGEEEGGEGRKEWMTSRRPENFRRDTTSSLDTLVSHNLFFLSFLSLSAVFESYFPPLFSHISYCFPVSITVFSSSPPRLNPPFLLSYFFHLLIPPSNPAPPPCLLPIIWFLGYFSSFSFLTSFPSLPSVTYSSFSSS